MSEQPASPKKKSFSERFRSKNAVPLPPDKEAGRRVANSTNWYVKILHTAGSAVEDDPICTGYF